MLNKPEKVLELEKFYVSVTYSDTESEADVATMEIVLKDTGAPGTLYISNGTLKLYENVYELSDSGNIVKWHKGCFYRNIYAG